MTKAVAEGLAQAPHRGSRGGARGEGRHGRDGDRRRQPLPPRRRGRASTSSRSTMPRSAQRRSRGSRRCGPAATRTKVRAALDALEQGARGDENLLALSVEAARARARSARFPTRWSACSAATAPSRAGARHLRRRRASDGRWKAGRRGHALGRRAARPQAADHGRQDGPGRARPRRQPGLVAPSPTSASK